MKTNKLYTFYFLDGFVMSNNCINVEYMAGEVIDNAEGEEFLYNECFNTRRKTRNVAIEWLMFFINRGLKNAGYTNFYADNKQVMAYDKAHDGGLEQVLDVVEARVKEVRFS